MEQFVEMYCLFKVEYNNTQIALFSGRENTTYYTIAILVAL